MRRQTGPHDGTCPVDEVEYAGRTTGIVHHLGEQQGAQGRQFARLQHHGAARRERRTDLGCDLVERPVPGGDEAADADRLAHDGGAAARADERIGREIVTRDADMFGGQRHLGAARIGDSGPHLARDCLREQFQPLEDQTMDPVEQRCPLRSRLARPAREGSSGGGDRVFHILVIAERDFGDRLLGRRVDDDRRRRSGRLPPFSVDVEFAEEAGFRQVSNGRGHWKRSLMR